MTYAIAVCTVKTRYDGQTNCPKHVEFYSKNKFEKLMHLVGFIRRMYHDARSSERQIENRYVISETGKKFIHISVKYISRNT